MKLNLSLQSWIRKKIRLPDMNSICLKRYQAAHLGHYAFQSEQSCLKDIFNIPPGQRLSGNKTCLFVAQTEIKGQHLCLAPFHDSNADLIILYDPVQFRNYIF